MEFIGRTSQIDLINKFFISEDSILNVFGPLGIGKHSFIDEIFKNFIPESGKIIVSTNDKEPVLSLLIRIKNILTNKFSFQFPLFELCEGIYKTKNGDTFISNNQTNRIFESLKTIMNLLVGQTPTSIFELLGSTYTKFKKYRTEIQNMELINNILGADSRKIFVLFIELFYSELENNDNKSSFIIFIESFDDLIDNYYYSFGAGEAVKLFLNKCNESKKFKFVLSSIKKIKNDRIIPLELTNFTLEETNLFFKDFQLEYNFLLQIGHITSGNPSQLKIIKEYLIIKKPTINDLKNIIFLNPYNDFFLKTFNSSDKDILDFLSCLGTWSKEFANELISALMKQSNFSISPNNLQKIYESFPIESKGELYYIRQSFRRYLYKNCNEYIKKSVSDCINYKLKFLVEFFIQITPTEKSIDNSVILKLKDLIIVFRELIKYTVCCDSDFLTKIMYITDSLGKKCENSTDLIGLSLEFYYSAYDCAMTLYNETRDCNTYWNLRNCTKALSNFFFKINNISEGMYFIDRQVNYEYFHVDLSSEDYKLDAYIYLSDTVVKYLSKLVNHCESHKEYLDEYDRIFTYYIKYSEDMILKTLFDEEIVVIYFESLAKSTLAFKTQKMEKDEAKSHIAVMQIIKNFFNENPSTLKGLDENTIRHINDLSFYNYFSLFFLKNALNELEINIEIQFQYYSPEEIREIQCWLNQIIEYLNEERKTPIFNDYNYLLKTFGLYGKINL